MKTKCFTLIELLVVIAIIAILMGILLPAIGKVRESAKESKARTEMASIVTATKQFEADYGKLPTLTGSNNDEKFDSLTEILTFTTISGLQAPASGNAFEQNKKKIRYMDPTPTYKNKGFVDPWGRKYVVWLDEDYNGEITVDSAIQSDPVFSSIAIASYGRSKTATWDKKYFLISWK